MGHCKDCKHFVEQLEETYIEPPPGFGMCSITTQRESNPVGRSTLAYAQDAENYDAWLVVSFEFGCVQFKQK